MSGGCNSCKNLDPEKKNPGRTSGYLFYCNVSGKWVNAAKEDCEYYELDEGRSSFEVNEIYKDSYYYNDMKNDAGCNSCMNLDPESKKPGEDSGYLYYCKERETFVDATQTACEKYVDGHRLSEENNKIYEDSKNYRERGPRDVSFKGLLIMLAIFIIAFLIFIFMK